MKMLSNYGNLHESSTSVSL
jgi:hypothetical protein